MNRLMRGIVTGGVIGTVVGLAVLFVRQRGRAAYAKNAHLSARARRTLRMVRDNARHFTSAVKNGTEKMLSRRT